MGIDSSFDSELFRIMGFVLSLCKLDEPPPRIGELAESSSDDKETSDFVFSFTRSFSRFIFHTLL